MSGAGKVVGTGPKPAISEVVAGLACLAASAVFFTLARGLPQSASVGDVGPGALPAQVGVFGVLCSLIYLLGVMRGQFPEVPDRFFGIWRALAVLGIFCGMLLAVKWIGLAVAIACAGAVTTLLFRGAKPVLRAIVTGIGLWLIAFVIFQTFLDLPLP